MKKNRIFTKLLIICGSTASGKSDLALWLGKTLRGLGLLYSFNIRNCRDFCLTIYV
jgi:nicotinamide riboside kinase